MVQLAVSQAETVVVEPCSVICVDLEDLLLRTRPDDERLLAFLRQHPAAVARLPGWWWQGRAWTEIATRTHLGCDVLPLDARVLAHLHHAAAEGCQLVLLATLDSAEAHAIVRHTGLFTQIHGGLAKSEKRAFAKTTFGPDTVYLDRTAAAGIGIDFPALPARIQAVGRAMRLHQWVKNALLFVPVALLGPLAVASDWLHALVAFVVFGLLASAGYLANDLLDLDADRRHSTKRRRPFADGTLPLRLGALGVSLLVLAAAALCLLLPAAFAPVAGLYLVTTLAYSFYLKQQPILDVIVLACLFTVRIVAGALLLTNPSSYWLFTFALFFFFGLATAKRVVELKAEGAIAKLRGYNESDLLLLIPLGIASVVAANVIFVTYLIVEHFPGSTYSHPEWLWLILLILLYWPLHLWRMVLQGSMHDDPVVSALRDRTSQALGVLVTLLLLLAW